MPEISYVIINKRNFSDAEIKDAGEKVAMENFIKYKNFKNKRNTPANYFITEVDSKIWNSSKAQDIGDIPMINTNINNNIDLSQTENGKRSYANFNQTNQEIYDEDISVLILSGHLRGQKKGPKPTGLPERFFSGQV